MTRTTLTKFTMHHAKSANQRLYLSRAESGRGLINTTNHCRTQEHNMREYFHNSNNPLLRKVIECDVNYTLLNLSKHHEYLGILPFNEEAHST